MYVICKLRLILKDSAYLKMKQTTISKVKLDKNKYVLRGNYICIFYKYEYLNVHFFYKIQMYKFCCVKNI